MSEAYRAEHREKMGPFTKILEAAHTSIQALLLSMDDESAEAVRMAAYRQSTTNCGWQEYEAGRAVSMWYQWSRNQRALQGKVAGNGG